MKFIKDAFKGLVYKRGQFSKTALFLSLATIALLGLWVFQSLFAGVTLLGWWLIPEFSVGAATAVMSILSTLYLVNHSSLVSGKDPTVDEIVETKAKVDDAIKKISGREDE